LPRRSQPATAKTTTQASPLGWVSHLCGHDTYACADPPGRKALECRLQPVPWSGHDRGVLRNWPRQRWRRAAAMCQHLVVLSGGPVAPSPASGRPPDNLAIRCTRSARAIGSCMCSAGCASGRSSRSARRPGTAGGVSRALRRPPVPGANPHHRGRHRLRGHRHHARPPGAGRGPQPADLPGRGSDRGRGRHVSQDGRRLLRSLSVQESTGWPSPPRPTWKPAWPGDQASRFSVPATQAPGRTRGYGYPLLSRHPGSTATPTAPRQKSA
jgi:hypothetical protein